MSAQKYALRNLLYIDPSMPGGANCAITRASPHCAVPIIRIDCDGDAWVYVGPRNGEAELFCVGTYRPFKQYPPDGLPHKAYKDESHEP